MDKPRSVAELTELGRVRLSEHFFMRDMLYSEVANFHGMPNIPEDPDLAIATGEKLCQLVLEPMHRTFGGIVVRLAYRSPGVNDFCHQRLIAGENAYYCSDNVYGAARHIWDIRDADGHMGATASVIVPWYLERYAKRTIPGRSAGGSPTTSSISPRQSSSRGSALSTSAGTKGRPIRRSSMIRPSNARTSC